MSYNFFYVFTRDGQIFELKYDATLLITIAKTMTDKGLITLKEYGIILNGVDISKVLNENQYDDYIFMVSPKKYIKNGSWYDGKENRLIKHTDKKQALLNEKKEIESREIIETPEQRERINAIGRETLRKLREGSI